MPASLFKLFITRSPFAVKCLFPTWALIFLLYPVVAQATEFNGYPCQTADCSGHEAGYAWAEKYNISDPDDCTSNSQSFIEGCWAYASDGSGHIVDDYAQEENGQKSNQWEIE